MTSLIFPQKPSLELEEVRKLDVRSKLIELTSMKNVELVSMNNVELASMNNVELTNMNNVELAGQHEQR